MDVRHAMLNKYGSADDDAFLQVSFKLKEFAEAAGTMKPWESRQ